MSRKARQQLRYFNYGDYSDDGSFSVDFLTMLGELSTFRDYTGDPVFDEEKPTVVHVRRISSSAWQTKIAEDSRKQEIAQIAALRKDAIDDEDHADLDERLEQLEKWQDVPGEIVGALEVQYQKYLLRGQDA